MFLKNIFNLSTLVLITALTLSGIAAWYSILGLVAIFAAAAIPIIIMGGSLEVAKVVTTVWLHRYWHQVTWRLKLYLVPAVIALAFLTSMGIFGFLSKAHMDQGIVSGDSQAKLSLLDEKIKIQRENIEAARKALSQMDTQVDQRLSRSDNEQGAERAIQIRRQQLPERNKLLKEINDAQSQIAKLNEERAPIAAENRKIEAEVGPIKYIAALIYGDNPDSNLLERAVRWVIILIVFVFDPLALTLVIAANTSREWDKKEKNDVAAMNINPESVATRPVTKEEIEALDEPVITPWPTEWKEWKNDDVEHVSGEILKDIVEEKSKIQEKIEKIHHPDTHPYLNSGFKYPKDWIFEQPMVLKPDEQLQSIIDEEPIPVNDNIDGVNLGGEFITDIDTKAEIAHKSHIELKEEPENAESPKEIITEGITSLNSVKDLGNGYVIYDDRSFSKEALKQLQPNLFAVKADNVNSINTNFGTEFPKIANKGDVFVRVDLLPNKVFKFDGKRWIEINKNLSDTYLTDFAYIQFLISKIDSGEYDIEMLTDAEKQQIEDFLNNQKS